MDQVIGRALTVLAGAACYAVAFIWCQGADKQAAFAVLTNAGTFMLGTLVTGAGQVSISVAERLRGKSDPPPPPAAK